MPLLHDGSDESRSKNIATLIEEGKPEKQAVAIAYSIQRRASSEDDPEEVGKADTGPIEEENRLIRKNMQMPQAHGRHDFKPAKWTAGNGHPRCIFCGDEEPEGGVCMGIHGAIPTNGDSTAHLAKAEPSEAQKRAGNYAKTHWTLHGMRIAIENLAGTKRSGVDHEGKPWEVTMPYHYGYIKGTEGADGDHLDVAVGPLMDQGTEAHIINQRGPDGEFDEHKVFIGYPSRGAAIQAFRAGRSDDPDEVMGAVITVPIEELKRWIEEGCLQEEAVLKAEASHVKAHYRIQNGRVVYIPNYDRTVHGDHPEATLHQRTVLGRNSTGTPFIRATDAADREKILEAARSLGVVPEVIRPSGANHHGRQNSYPTMFFHTYEQSQQVMDAVRVRHGDIGHEHTVQQPTRGAGALAAGIARMNAQREETRAAQAAAASAPVRVITPAQVAANEEPRPAAQPSRAEENAARNRFFGHHNAGILDRQVYLENTTPGHNKLDVIDLRQVGEGQWVVNAGNGRIDGRSMTVRTKTDRPMSQAAANALVSQLKAEKINGGYHPIEDSASPRHRFTNMDQFNHPAVNIDTPIQGGVIRPAGVSVQTPARPAVATTPVPTPAPAATPAAAAPAPAPASAATTRALAASYSSLRQTAYDLGNMARQSEGNNTVEGFRASLKAAQAHEAAIPAARAANVVEGSDRGPGWHSNRAQYWLGKAKQQWTGAVTPALSRSGAHSAVATGQGFADAVRAIEGSQSIMAQRPRGAALPPGVTEADYASAVAHQDATLKALKIGEQIEREIRPGTAPGAQAAGLTSTIMDSITRGNIPHDHAPQARRIADSIQNLLNASNAARDMAADPAAEPETLRVVAQTVAAMHTAANSAMSTAPDALMWRNAPKRVVEELAKVGEKAKREADRRAAMPRKSDPRYAAGHEQHAERAAQAHAAASASSADRPKLIQALDAHKQAAVSIYHAALAAPKGSPERARLMQKAQEHAQHARDFVTKLNTRR